MTDPIENFIELMGMTYQVDGAPRIAGRIFGLLLVEDEPYALQDIATRLQVSKASASTNARFLAERGVIRLTSKPGIRQDFYELVPDVYRQMALKVSARMMQVSNQIAEVHEAIPSEQSIARDRIANLAECYRLASETAIDWSDRLPPSK
ncbi:MAG: hypothetical protein ABJ000_16085 [Saccharospirillum sp.]|uniref:GbsR/MarR family transcriptional regulator n=1 Tax=Saccharospirillum sp. TaxID=2033801 RepID=UPI0032995F99